MLGAGELFGVVEALTNGLQGQRIARVPTTSVGGNADGVQALIIPVREMLVEMLLNDGVMHRQVFGPLPQCHRSSFDTWLFCVWRCLCQCSVNELVHNRVAWEVRAFFRVLVMRAHVYIHLLLVHDFSSVHDRRQDLTSQRVSSPPRRLPRSSHPS